MRVRPCLKSGCRAQGAPFQTRDAVMLFCLNLPDSRVLGDRLGESAIVTPPLFQEVVDKACRRFPSLGHSEKSARIERLIAAHAWIEAALALIELELPLWRLRRIAYDGGEWHCALSRERELNRLARPLDRGAPSRPRACAADCVCRSPATCGSVKPAERACVSRQSAPDCACQRAVRTMRSKECHLLARLAPARR